MIKKLHYIKEDHSGSVEQTCLTICKEIYPDYEFMAWKPGSSPWRILYDNGGLFVGQGMIPVKALPEEYLQKPFFVFDNVFDSTNISRRVCFSNEPKNPIFLEIMNNGLEYISGKVSNEPKIKLNEKDFQFDEFNIFNRNQFGYVDSLSKTLPENESPYFIDIYPQRKTGLSDYIIHYKLIDKNTNVNKLYSICENFSNLKCENGTKHFLLLVYNLKNLNIKLANVISELLTYNCHSENKMWDMIISPNGSASADMATEYIARNFNNTVSCEKV